jgi:putative component of toxin-antitoxin plasmid stabilization module
MGPTSGGAAWNVEMYSGANGHCPVETWMDGLSAQKYAALLAAINRRLAVEGMGLSGTPWLTPIGNGLYEFRIRISAAQIERMYGDADEKLPAETEKILLRVFVTFYGNRVVLLLDGYDKATDPSEKRQQREIATAYKLLRAWKMEQARARRRR